MLCSAVAPMPVSIRSRHTGREKDQLARSARIPCIVSIRSRHTGREKASATRSALPGSRSVSIRSRHTGREKGGHQSTDSASVPGFNPLPAHGPGESPRGRPAVRRIRRVSIRSRHTGREKGRIAAVERRYLRFQSAPGTRAGRKVALAGSRSGVLHGFNPLPARAGRKVAGSPPSIAGIARFNPLPAHGPGERSAAGCSGRWGRSFNPLPAHGPGESGRPPGDRLALSSFQSAPGARAGRSRRRRRVPLDRPVSIRSRRTGREKAVTHGLEPQPPVSIRSRHTGREKGL